MASPKRDLLVDNALRLFNEQGYRATGIDKILAKSGVAKMTLYKYFKSKDELIIAALSKRAETFSSWIDEAMSRLEPQQEGDPRLRRVMALFDALHEWFNTDTFNGCNFINASVEFKRQDDPIHVAVAAHKKLMIQTLQGMLSELHLDNTHLVAKQIHMIVEGSIIVALTLADKTAAQVAKDSVQRLLSSYTVSPPLQKMP